MSLNIRKLLALAVLCTAVPLFAQTTSDSTPHIMIVGTYHMANPGRDMVNVKADDVLSAKRQKEIEEVVAELRKFSPTKIVIEQPLDSEKVQQRYADYVAGKYELTRNEVDQLAFRLAKELGHKKVYPVDVEYRFRADEMINYAKAHGQGALVDGFFAAAQRQVNAINDHLKNGTVLETLRYMNAPEQVAADQAIYMGAAKIGDATEHPGDDMLTDWYERNIRIFSNIERVTEPGDRVLVLYGAGHLYWLQTDARDAGMIVEQFK